MWELGPDLLGVVVLRLIPLLLRFLLPGSVLVVVGLLLVPLLLLRLLIWVFPL